MLVNNIHTFTNKHSVFKQSYTLSYSGTHNHPSCIQTYFHINNWNTHTYILTFIQIFIHMLCYIETYEVSRAGLWMKEKDLLQCPQLSNHRYLVYSMSYVYYTQNPNMQQLMSVKDNASYINKYTKHTT